METDERPLQAVWMLTGSPVAQPAGEAVSASRSTVGACGHLGPQVTSHVVLAQSDLPVGSASWEARSGVKTGLGEGWANALVLMAESKQPAEGRSETQS